MNIYLSIRFIRSLATIIYNSAEYYSTTVSTRLLTGLSTSVYNVRTPWDSVEQRVRDHHSLLTHLEILVASAVPANASFSMGFIGQNSGELWELKCLLYSSTAVISSIR